MVSGEFVVPANDYQANLEVVERFPFNLYHGPIRAHVLRVIRQQQEGNSLRILNVGCGLSQILDHIEPIHEYVGVDIDPRNIEACRRRFPDRRAHFEICHEQQLPFEDDRFDVVFATEVIEHIPQSSLWLKELIRVLRPGGRLQLSTPNYGDFTLPLIESTFLELIARRKGFTRRGLHPNPYTAQKLRRELTDCGLGGVEVAKTPGRLALVASGYKPLRSFAPLTLAGVNKAFRDLAEQIPTALACREAMRLVALQKRLPSTGQVLDVGCGDGSFWKALQRPEGLEVDGIDLNKDEIALAKATGVYRYVRVLDIAAQVPERFYDLAVGNCSLEHVPNIHAALANIRQSLKPGGVLLLFVPAFGWCRSLSFVKLLRRLFGVRLEMAAAGCLDGFFQHHHIHDSTSWRLLVEAAGYRVVKIQSLGGQTINRTFDRGLPLAFLEFLFKLVRRRYPRFGRDTDRLPARLFEELFEQPVAADHPHTVEYLIEAVPLATPPARPPEPDTVN